MVAERRAGSRSKVSRPCWVFSSFPSCQRVPALAGTDALFVCTDPPALKAASTPSPGLLGLKNTEQSSRSLAAGRDNCCPFSNCGSKHLFRASLALMVKADSGAFFLWEQSPRVDSRDLFLTPSYFSLDCPGLDLSSNKAGTTIFIHPLPSALRPSDQRVSVSMRLQSAFYPQKHSSLVGVV